MSTLTAYPLPNATGQSAQETARLESQHHMWMVEFGAPTLRPFPPNMKKVLDIGCGNGIWTRTMAAQYPETNFLGVDVDPPAEGELETATNNNCRFLKGNVEDEWTFVDEPGTVDFTMSRMLTTSIRDWQGLYDKAFAATRPGGYFESVETWIGCGSDDDEKYKDSEFLRWFGHFRDFMAGKRIELESIDTHGKRLEAAGFKLIAEKPIKWCFDPARPEMKGKEEISWRYKKGLFDFFDVVTPRIFASSPTMTLEEGEKLAADAKEDITNNGASRGYYHRFCARLAQKPL